MRAIRPVLATRLWSYCWCCSRWCYAHWCYFRRCCSRSYCLRYCSLCCCCSRCTGCLCSCCRARDLAGLGMHMLDGCTEVGSRVWQVAGGVGGTGDGADRAWAKRCGHGFRRFFSRRRWLTDDEPVAGIECEHGSVALAAEWTRREPSGRGPWLLEASSSRRGCGPVQWRARRSRPDADRTKDGRLSRRGWTSPKTAKRAQAERVWSSGRWPSRCRSSGRGRASVGSCPFVG